MLVVAIRNKDYLGLSTISVREKGKGNVLTLGRSCAVIRELVQRLVIIICICATAVILRFLSVIVHLPPGLIVKTALGWGL
jgi:hypothetical protein